MEEIDKHKNSEEIENKKTDNNIENIEKEEKQLKDTIICYDKTINEISDKKWSKYLISYKSILSAKRKIKKDKDENLYKEDELIKLIDINGKQCNLLSKIIDEYNENNQTYHWLQIPDINNKIILVKKEHLLMQKMTNEEVEVLDYNCKKYKIIPGKVCRLAKKYHITTGPGEENILYLIKDLSNNYQFITKTVINFAKTKRRLNDEMHTLKITDKNNNIIEVNSDIIRDLEDFNIYSEWCEIEDINNNKIVVKKKDLVDCKEIYDKNIDGGNEIQKINDWKYDVYDININSQYSRYFPSKYIYLSNGEKRDEYSEVNDINKNKINIKTSLIEYYLSENIKDLSLYEEIYDKDKQIKIINPNEIIKNILLSYDDISDSNGPFVELATQSGSKHLIKVNTIIKILKIAKEKGNKNDKNKVSIKDNNGNKIYTSLNKIKEIDLKDENTILLGFNDVNGDNCYFKKKDILNKVNDILINLENEDFISLNDINGVKKYIQHSQIKIINNKIKKNIIKI